SAVAKDHEILAEDPHSQRRRREIALEGDRLPETAQILPAQRAGTDLGQLGIGQQDFTATVAVEWTGLRLGGTPAGSLHGTFLSPASKQSQVADARGVANARRALNARAAPQRTGKLRAKRHKTLTTNNYQHP